MRITQRSMYNSFVSSMNRNLSDYMESNIQGSSQKRINRPSDDPVGMARVLSYRASIERNVQYENNSKDAAAWLSSTDSALLQTEVLLRSIQEKTEQIATGTITSENREQVSSQLRQLLGQLINIANTEYNGQHLFSGTKTNIPAYQLGLGVTASGVTNNTNTVAWKASGNADKTTMIRFPDDGDIPPAAGTTLDYEFTKDGGKTWTTKTLAAGQRELDLDGTTLSLPVNQNGTVQVAHVTAYDPTKDTHDDAGNITNVSRDNGTVLFVRPAVFYQGDDNDLPPEIDIYGNATMDPAHPPLSSGKFSSDVRIRLDEKAVANQNGKVAYSYSTDNGVTWVNAMADTRAGESKIRFSVPGGYLDVTPQAGTMMDEGQQFVIRPRRADLGMEIAQGEFISVTNAGKDIFGGQYAGPGQENPTPVDPASKNIFETVCNLINWAENGIQAGCQEGLAALKTAQEGLMTNAAKVGGKETRVSLNVSILESHRDDQTTRMSSLEDVDLTTLLTRLTQQQLAYQTVLQSSSMIMKLNLTNFI